MRPHFSCIFLFLTTFVVGCGGQGTPAPPPPPTTTITSVTVSPSSVSLLVKAPQQFTANVQGTGAFNSAVTWLVNSVPGGNSTVGTITSSGLYTAPAAVPSPNNTTITAQSVQDSTKSGSGTVTINPENVKVSISPPSGSAQLGTTMQFTATVTGTVNTAVLWSANTFVGGQTSVGFIDGNGNYTAPANLPPNNQVTVTATSQEDTTKSASAIVTILATAGGITVTISPQNPTVVFDGSQSIQFTASVSGTSNTAVTWSVDSLSFPTVGQISPSGLFTPLAFNCSNVPPTGAIRAASAANPGAQAVTLVNLVPPAPVITALSPQPADAGTLLQLSATYPFGAALTLVYPGPNGTSIPGNITGISSSGVSSPVPLGTASGPLSLEQTCVSGVTGFQYPSQRSNSLPFARLPRLRIRAHRQVLTYGESTQMLAAFLGDPTPRPITWSALFGTVTPAGVFTAGSSNWDKVTGCVSGTQQCDFFVFSVIPVRIEPTVPVVPIGAFIQLSEVQGTSTLSPTWSITAGGGTLNPTGLYTAATTLEDSGAIPIAATATAGNATNAIGVVGGFPGVVNRLIDYPDISANASGQTTIPTNLAVDGNKVYVLSDNLPGTGTNGQYKWIDTYDASDPVHPVWVGAVEGFDADLGDTFIPAMKNFASGGFLWRVTAPSIIGGGPGPDEVAFFDASNGQPIMKQFFTTQGMCADSFRQGVLIEIPCFTSSGQSLWQSSVTALVFDGRTGTVFPSQISLALANPSIPVGIDGIAISDTRMFLLFQEQQSNVSLPFFLSTYDFTTSTPTLLQTTPAQAGPLLVPGESPVRVFGNLLFAGGGIYDISSGLPVLLGPSAAGLPEDMSGSLALLGPFPNDKYSLVDYSSPASARVTSLLYNGDAFQGPARFVGNHIYLLGSGVQILDTSAQGGPIPQPGLQGNGTYGYINDMTVVYPNFYTAELTNLGPFVTSYDLSQTPPQRIGSFPLNNLNNEIPFALVPDGRFLFVGTSTELLVLDVTNPASPVKVTSLALPTSSLTLVGNVLYDGTTDNHLVVIDVTNPASPVVGSSTNLAGYPSILQSNGNLLLIAADTAGLLTFSISHPLAPVQLSQYRPSTAVEAVAIDGNLALLAAAEGGFVIADITNPSAPVLVGQVPLAALTCFADLHPTQYPPGLISISIRNGIAYLGGTNMAGRVFGFDYRQPAHPRLVSEASYGDAIAESVFAMAFSNSDMFIGGDLSSDRVFHVDITQPRNFIREMCFPPPFGSNAATVFPELQKKSLGTTVWKTKTQVKRDWTKRP